MNAVTPIMFYYNKDVLQKAGVKVPTTWDEVLAAVPLLKKAGVAPFSLAGASMWPELMWEEYLVDRVAGPQAFNDVMAGKAGSWSNPGIIKANSMIRQLVDAGGFIDGFASVTADSNADVALLYTGKAAMMLQGAWVYGTQSPDKRRVLPLSLWTFAGQFTVNIPAVLAAVVLSTLPIFVLYIFGRRQLVSGMTAGFNK